LLNIHNPSLETIYALASIKERNTTLPYILLNGSLEKTYKIKKTLYKLSKDIKDANKKIDNWVRATLYGKYLESWQYSLDLWNDISFQEVIEEVIYIKFDNPSFIIDVIEAISNLDYIVPIYRKCAIIAILCMDDLGVEKGIKPLDSNMKMNSNMKMYIEYWKSTYGCRKGRAYAIKKECLYGRSTRGLMTVEESNLSDIYNSEELIKGQKVYNELVNIFGSFEAFKEDSNRYDQFYSHFFHDDIPDEWSLEEQEKSHGKGILSVGEKPSFEKFFYIWVNKDSECFISEKDSILKEYIQKYPCKTFDFEIELIKKYETSTFNMKALQESIVNI
jgi:hypothetical protein